MRTLSLGLLLLGSACADKAKDSPADSAPDDTTDSVPPDDTGPDIVPRTGDISGSITLPEGVTEAATIKVALVRIEYGDGPDLRETLAVTGALNSAGAADYTLSLRERPPDEAISELDDGLWGALYIPLVFVDQDDNGSFVSGERIAGGGLSRLVVWLEGALPDGVPLGWSVVDTGLSGSYETGNCLLDTTSPLSWREPFNKDYPAFYGLDEPVEVSLRGLLADVVVGGQVAGLEEGTRVALLPYQVVYAGEPLDKFPSLGDLALDKAGRFSRLLDTEPDTGLDVAPDPAWDYALSFAVTYTDADGSGGYSTGEAAGDASLCSGNSLAAVRYTWPVREYRGWRLMECYDVVAGWRVVTRNSGGVWVSNRTAAESEALQIDETICSR